MRGILVIFIFTISLKLSGQSFTISGQIRDEISGELLGGVSVYDSLSGKGTSSNSYGFFSLSLAAKPKALRFSHVGYQSHYYQIKEKLELEIRLKRNEDLAELKIIKNKTTLLPGNPLSLPIHEIRNMPSLLGEADVLKAFSFTPGVATGNEGSAGIFVRGGTPDQNLILLDDVPVYNAMHLGGFFSVFNPASLKSAELYKGAFPARFGGRLSSVIDLTMKEGNNQKLGGEIGLGLLNQNLTLEGPIIKNKASFIVSGRVSTLGLTSFIKKKRLANTAGEDYTYRFHDFNAKLNYQISKNDHLYLSFYNGNDRFKYEEWQRTNTKEVFSAVGNNWGNSTGTIRYSKIISPKLFSRAMITYSKYNSQFTNNFSDSNQDFFRYSDTKVEDLGGKLMFEYFPINSIEIRAGINLTRHRFFPFHISTNYTDLIPEQETIKALQGNIFVDSDIKISPKLMLNAGVRFTQYKVNNTTFNNPEPRLGLNWLFTKNWKLLGSYTIMNQYVHLLVNNGYGFGYDAWLPATPQISPSQARQWSFGLAREISKLGLEISAEYYRKSLKNLIDYPDGTNFSGMFAEPWDEIVKSGGIGRGSGLELMISRNIGKLRGRVSYTLSKSELQFDDINEGKWYPMRYDRRHNLNFSLNYSFTKKWSLNSTFIYQSGHPITLPVGVVMYQGKPNYIYHERNNGNMPAFHKLDVGATRYGKLWDKYKTKLSFGVYNMYNRANPLYLDFKQVYHDPSQSNKPSSIVVKQYSLFPFLPFINYSVEF